MMQKIWPISNDFGYRSPAIQKTFHTKIDTSIVARVREWQHSERATQSKNAQRVREDMCDVSTLNLPRQQQRVPVETYASVNTDDWPDPIKDEGGQRYPTLGVQQTFLGSYLR